MTKTKKILGIVLAIMILTLAMAISVFAETVTTEDQLAASLTAGGEVTLGGDINVNAMITIPSGVEVTLDLNGYKIIGALNGDSTTKHIYAISNEGTLVINDSGDNGAIVSRGVYNYGSLTLNDGTIEACDGNGGYAINNESGSTFVMNGGALAVTYDDDPTTFDTGDATGIDVCSGNTTTINGGKITSVSNWCYSIACSGGTLNITNSNGNVYVEGAHGTVSVNGGSIVTIDGGTFVCAGASNASSDHVIYATSGSITINGGSFTNDNTDAGSNGAAIHCSGGNAEVEVNDGTFVGCETVICGNSTTVVNGGSYELQFDNFSTEDDLKQYVATGATIKVDGTTVVKSEDGTLTEATGVAKVNGVEYVTLEAAFAAAQAGDEIILLANVEGDILVPANVIFNGNGYTISGTLTANGDITFAGVTKAAKFAVYYTNTTVTIGKDASLQLNGARITVGYGCVFNIEGNITDAKTANKADVVPSFVVAGGLSITGGTGVTFNVKNAYVSFGNTSSKDSVANGTFDFSFENSIVEFTNQFTLSTPASTLNPVFNVTFKDSVVTTSAKMCFAATGSNVVVDNSDVNIGTNFHNSGNVEIKNGSTFVGSMIQYGENGGNSGTITVDNASFTINNNNPSYAMDGNNTGKIILKNGATASVDYIAETEVTLGAGTSLACKTENLEIVSESGYNAVYENGKYELVVAPVAQIDGVKYATFEEAIAAANAITEGVVEIVLLADVEFDGGDIDTNVVLDLNGYTITSTGSYFFWLDPGVLTIKDSSASKTGKLNGVTTSNAILACGNSSLTIESGIIYSNANVIYTGSTGNTVVINGGELKSLSGTDAVLYLAGSESTVTVNNGTLIGKIPFNYGTLVVKGGLYSEDVSAYCQAGFGTQLNGDGLYEIIEVTAENACAMIGDKYFLTLNAALVAAKETDTIVVLKDYEGMLNTLRGKLVPAEGKTVTITATNEGWYYLPYDFEIGAGVTLNVPNGMLFVHYTDSAVISGDVTASGLYLRYAGTKLIINEPGSLTITGETFIVRDVEGDAQAGIYVVGDNNAETVGLKASVIYFYQGIISAKDANIVTGVYWQRQETDADAFANAGTANLVLDNSTLTTTTIDHSMEATGNSTVTLTNGSKIVVARGYEGVAVYADATSTVVKANGENVFAASVSGKLYTTLAEAIAALKDGDTLTIFAGEHSEGSIKFPASLANVTIKGEDGAILKDMTLAAHDGSNISYTGITFDNITFNNSNILFSGQRASAVYKDWTIKNCTFTDVARGDAAISFNLNTTEAMENFTFTGNTIDGVTGGNLSGLVLRASKGTVVISDNNIKNAVWNAIQVLNSTGKLTIENNTLASGADEGVLNLYGVTATELSIKNNKFILDAGQPGICYLTAGDVSENYWGGEAPANLPEGVTCESYYADEALTELVTIAKPVAQIGDVKYTSLEEAFAAAQDGDVITLIEDITIESDLNNAGIGYFNITDGQKITLDLNGKTINVTDNSQGNFIVFYNYGEFIIKNGTVNLTSTYDRDWNAESAIILNRGGILTVESGTYTHNGGTDMAFVVDNSGNYFGDATTYIKGGTLTSSYIAIRNRMEQNSHGASGKAILNISGGTIDGTSRAIWAQASSTSTTSPATGEINVSGGEIGLIDTARSAGAVSMTTISGGTVAAFKGEVNELTVKGGTLGEVTILTASGEAAEFTVTSEGLYAEAVAQIGDVKYATLAEAIAAAQAGDEITLIDDVVLAELLTIAEGKDVTLDLAGKKITTANDTINIEIYGKLTIKDTIGGGISTVRNHMVFGELVLNNGTLTNIETATGGFPINLFGGTVTIDGGAVKALNQGNYAIGCNAASKLTINAGTIEGNFGCVNVNYGTEAEINGGTFNVTGAIGGHCVYVGNGSVVINNGDFNPYNTNPQYTSYSVFVNGASASATINGGSFDKNVAGNPIGANGGTLVVYGGSFVVGDNYVNKLKSFLADGYVAIRNFKDMYVVGTEPSATVNNQGALVVPGGDYLVQGGGDNTMDMPLSFVMQFLASQTAADMANSPYADWYADFVITFTGIENGQFTADGCYLAGYYGDFGWVKVPVDGMEITEGARYPVMLGVGMGQKYDYICESVKDFRCALYLTPEILAANPNLKVNLELSVIDNSMGETAAKDALASTESVYTHKVVDDTYIAEEFKVYLAQIGEVKYETLQAAINAVKDGETITVLADIVLKEAIIINNEVKFTLDLGEKVVALADDNEDVNCVFNIIGNGEITITNGTVETNNGQAIYVGKDENGVSYAPTVNFANVTLTGVEYGLSVFGNATVVIDAGTVITGSIEAIRVEDSAKATIKAGSKITCTGENAAVIMVCGNATVIIEGGEFKGVAVNADETSTLTITGGSFSIDPSEYLTEEYVAIRNFGDMYVVGTEPNATVNNQGALVVPGGDYIVQGGGDNTVEMPLSFVMQFLANQTAADMANSPYADWYADFVITFTGIENGKFTADGCYLAGYYGDFGWVKVPVDGMEITEGARYPVMLGVGMGQKYSYICEGVKDFRCALYLTPEILAANPDLKVNLELSVIDNSKGETVAKDALTSTGSVYTHKVVDDTYIAEEFVVEYVAQIGENKYASLQGAIDAAKVGDVITLLSDIALTETLTVADGKVITLDLNGYVVSYEDASGVGTYLIKNYGDLTIKSSKDGGKITFVSTTPDTSFGYATSTIGNAGNLVVESGIIENTTNGGASYAIDTIWYTKDVSLTINGGEIKAVKIAVRQVPFSSTYKYVVNINGGTLTGAYAGLQTHYTSANAYLAEVNISGGTFNGTYAYYTSYASNNGHEGTTINITDGTFNGYIYIYNGNAGSADYDFAGMTISGGTFNNYVYVYTRDSESGYVYTPSIKGGTFATPVSLDNCAIGFVPTDNGDGTYGVTRVEIAWDSATLSIESELQMNFYLKTISIIDGIDYYARVIKHHDTGCHNQAECEIIYIPLQDWVDLGNGKTRITVNGIAAKDMACRVEIQIFVGEMPEDTKVPAGTYADGMPAAEGSQIASTKGIMSVRSYCEEVFKKTDADSVAHKALLANLLLYGEAAQKYFGHYVGTEDAPVYVTNGIKDIVDSYATEPTAVANVSKWIGGNAKFFKQYSLSLEDTTYLNFYFRNLDAQSIAAQLGVDASTIDLTKLSANAQFTHNSTVEHNSTYVFTTDENATGNAFLYNAEEGTAFITIDDLAAADLEKIVTVTLTYDGTTLAQFSTNATSYCAIVKANKGNEKYPEFTEELDSLGDRIVALAQEAEKVFAPANVAEENN